MVNSNYQKGAKFERAIISTFKKAGYSGFRSAGSHSPVDIILVAQTEEQRPNVVLAQCKRYSKGKPPLPSAEFKALKTPSCCVKWWVTRKDREQVKVEIVP
jgi:Holliday junction resolvase